MEKFTMFMDQAASPKTVCLCLSKLLQSAVGVCERPPHCQLPYSLLSSPEIILYLDQNKGGSCLEEVSLVKTRLQD